VVGCILTSTQPASGEPGSQSNGIVGFARGELRSQGEKSLAGDLDQYLSDRVHGGAAHPFNPEQRDMLGVTMTTSDPDQEVTVALVAHSWGGEHQTLYNLRMEKGMLVGEGTSVGHQTPSALYCFSLSAMTAP
jgi:hypothetical protein